MNNLKHTIEYLNNAVKELKKLEDERDNGNENLKYDHEDEWDIPTQDLSLGEKLRNAEERGIKKTMRYLKNECWDMSFSTEDGYFVEENELNEDDESLIELIKQM